jgi:hypothetical protein
MDGYCGRQEREAGYHAERRKAEQYKGQSGATVSRQFQGYVHIYERAPARKSFE